MNKKQNNKFVLFAGIRAFQRLENGYVSVTDVETKYSVTEEYSVIYNILKIYLTEKQQAVFDREYTSNNVIYIDFNTNKLKIVKDKKEYDKVSMDLSINIINKRLLSEDRDNYFINY